MSKYKQTHARHVCDRMYTSVDKISTHNTNLFLMTFIRIDVSMSMYIFLYVYFTNECFQQTYTEIQIYLRILSNIRIYYNTYVCVYVQTCIFISI